MDDQKLELQKLELEGIINDLFNSGKIDKSLFRYGDFSVCSKGQYYGRVFIKTLLSKEKCEEAKKPENADKRIIVGFHIRPYKINIDDTIVLKDEPDSPFKNDASDIKIDYHSDTGNFHKIIRDNEKLEFQVVLVASNAGTESKTPISPDFDTEKEGKDWEFKNGNKCLTKRYKEAIDEVGMYFPKLSEKPCAPTSDNLYKLLEKAAAKAGISLK